MTQAPANAKTVESEQQSENPVVEPVTSGKKIIVFADGTGNAFSTQESNVWRLYQALDRSRPDQIARYIQGVGTSGNRIIATLDGITGFGVPSNVRKLYRFICWNWEKGDEIYMFGFSRGAFTIRCLASLIHSQGLMPKEIDGRLVTNAEMHANAKGAWREYRRSSAEIKFDSVRSVFSEVFPTVGLARFVRDKIVQAYRAISGHRQHSAVLELLKTEKLEPRRAGNVEIKFLGLFDTVEAYGVPVEELRKPINYFIWPISFRNRICSKSVKTVRHALSIDDERRTFHPVRFDQTQEDKPATEISEVWFSGMHSDVGGGYPDGSLSYAPLAWMAQHAADADLRFKDNSLNYYTDRFSPFAHIHDSRTGLAAFYRYAPRTVATELANVTAPVIHPTVMQKIQFGSEGYAPITLPDKIDVLDEAAKDPKTEQSDQDNENKCEVEEKHYSKGDALIFFKCRRPKQPKEQTLRDLISLRRRANYALLFSLVFIAFLPLVSWLYGLVSDTAPGTNWLTSLVALIVDGLARVLPEELNLWLKAMRQLPYLTAAAVLVLIIAFFFNSSLRDVIKDWSLSFWQKKKTPELWLFARPFVYLMKLRRRHPRTAAGLRYTSIGVVLLITLFFAAVTANKTYLSTETAAVNLCSQGEQPQVTTLSTQGVAATRPGFSPSFSCWSTGVNVQEGVTYSVKIDQSGAENKAFVDRTIPAGASPFVSNNLEHLIMAPTFRRRSDADWFQPIAQIGRHAEESFVLQATDGQPPLPVPRKDFDYDKGDELPVWKSWKHLNVGDRENFEKKLVELNTNSKAFGGEVGIPLVFSSQFTAPASGELFLYVNDVLIAGDRRIFYRNNAGSATVTVTAVSNPVFPKSQTQDHASFKN